jgi:hypothetical protein
VRWTGLRRARRRKIPSLKIFGNPEIRCQDGEETTHGTLQLTMSFASPEFGRIVSTLTRVSVRKDYGMMR